MRWGIETSFRNLKHTLGLLHLHAKKGGVRSPGDFCQAHHVQLLRIDYTVRSHPAGTENIHL